MWREKSCASINFHLWARAKGEGMAMAMGKDTLPRWKQNERIHQQDTPGRGRGTRTRRMWAAVSHYRAVAT